MGQLILHRSKKAAFVVMKLIIRDNDDDVGEWAARYVKKRILDFKPALTDTLSWASPPAQPRSRCTGSW